MDKNLCPNFCSLAVVTPAIQDISSSVQGKFSAMALSIRESNTAVL